MPTPDFVQRTDTGRSTLALRAAAPRVLEIHFMWDDLVINTRHYAPGSAPVSLGEGIGWRWRCLGVDMGWVRPELRHILPAVLPMITEVESAQTDDFLTPAELLDGQDHVELCRWVDGEAMLCVPSGWTAEIGGHGRAWAFVPDTELAVPTEALLRLRRDNLSFVISRVRAAHGIAARPDMGPDRSFAGVFSVVAAAGLMLGIALASQTPPPTNEVVEVPERILSLVYQAPEPPPEVESAPAAKPKSKGEEGKTGKEEGTASRARANKSENEGPSMEGVGILDTFGDPALAAVFGGGLSDGIMDSVGGLSGPKGVAFGNNGLGHRGIGPGGGGEAEGTYIQGTCTGGLERCGTADFGLGTDTKPGSAVPRVQDSIVVGGLDKSQIDEVIKRHMRSIRYCYQRQLQQEPTLSGKIVMKFTIAKDGSVSQASAKVNTIGGSAVEDCVVGRFLKMQFPEPKGGIVIVSYPFLFAPG